MTAQFVEQFGYVGLLIASFLASTLLPMSSEVFVLLMAQLGFNRWLILLFATTGNFLGALANYAIGKLGSRFFLSNYVSSDDKKLQKARQLYERWGAPILFFSWLPFIGDPLTMIPGILNSRLTTFTVWVLPGRALRYIFVLWLSAFLTR